MLRLMVFSMIRFSIALLPLIRFSKAVLVQNMASLAHMQIQCSSFTPKCDEKLKPKVGMEFKGLEAVEEFYKSYAHHVGFGVRIGQQKKLKNEVVRTKRFMCNREGYQSEKTKEIEDPLKKRRKSTTTRCGCDAHIFVRLCGDNTYKIDSWVERHTHGLVSPDKRHLIRSNRQISERAKNTLYTCHKASIGTCQAYRLLQVSEGGFENVGCTKDLQNYYRDFRYKMRNADAQMFVAQLARKQEVNPGFFYDFVVNDEGKLEYVFWADATSRKNYNHFGGDGVTFLRAMGGVAPSLIITDEAGSMKNAIDEVLPTTAHTGYACGT
ncbi:protein FAR1-RELATED SEQUENCE 5-like [Brachypodium distachyon]|uniref:protein FAR1-RELATED SEQUENCE 5-like n=1 Tax=Brachypodium distachyon TaxID=15368 RepID=UPI000D0CEC5F|nr:protein FAR1-RELATED SEQUENCE 5-like [Brachypodium distachyon]|eukprot:XP_024313699.1 protein FAR1-RELATED SEQUENCE 5-like [Brachypodium distachyon]